MPHDPTATDISVGRGPVGDAQIILRAAIASGEFPGAALSWAKGAGPLECTEAGTLGWALPFLDRVEENTRYDLASLTKLYTLATGLLLTAAAGKGMDLPLHSLLPAYPPEITLAHLANHSAGLTPELQSLEQVECGRWLDIIARSALSNAPGASVRYSCTHSFVLARAVEALGGAPLHQLMEELVIWPLGLDQTGMHASPSRGVAPTETRPAGGFWQGTVHDEAARVWTRETGGLCGNAGLFGTAADVARFGRSWTTGLVEPGSRGCGAELRQLVEGNALKENSYWRLLGWQMDAAFYMGPHAPSGTWGHLGFTGPCLLVHPSRGEVLAILCNRVHPTRNGPDRMSTLRALSSWFFDTTK